MSGACQTGLTTQSHAVREVPIRSAADLETARQAGREFAARIGFSGSDVTVIAAAISEIARNIVDYAETGDLTLKHIAQAGKEGIMIIARDEGPGIPNLAEALQYGCASRRGLGVGLPGAKWLMDEFEIDSKPGQGTTVTMRKWLE